MSGNIPTFLDISPTNGLCLDEKAAARHFFGKSITDAAKMISENPIYYTEYFKYMGPVGFNYYLNALLIYLNSKNNSFDDILIISLIQTVELRLKYEYNSYLVAKETISELMSFFEKNYHNYKVESDIYGDLRPRIKSIKTALS